MRSDGLLHAIVQLGLARQRASVACASALSGTSTTTVS
jgi:hypothetical protein